MLGAIQGMAGGKAEANAAARIGMNQLLEVGWGAQLSGFLHLCVCLLDQLKSINSLPARGGCG